MPGFADVIPAALAAAAFWFLIGWPAALSVAPRLAHVPEKWTPVFRKGHAQTKESGAHPDSFESGCVLAWCLAPTLGWALYSALALPLFSLIGMSRPIVLASSVVFAAAAFAALWRRRPLAGIGRPSPVLIIALFAAALLALVPTAAVLPKPGADGIALAAPIFDHSKIALIDEMIRSGVPPTNPFFGEFGAPHGVSYYYLWHFSAAVMATATGVGGWAADAALTWFTAFASLMLMIGLATALAGRAAAAVVVVALAATCSARLVLVWLSGPVTASSLIGGGSGFGGWLFQVSWAPQHVAAASCVIIACLLLAGLTKAGDRSRLVVLGLVAVAAFESSLWVGGVLFPLAAAAIMATMLAAPGPRDRRGFVVRAAGAAALALVLAAPMLREQIVTSWLRGSGVPIAVSPVHALGETFADLGRWLDLPAYWLAYLPIELPAVYPVGLAGLWLLMRRSPPNDAAVPPLVPLVLLTAASLVAAWLLVSTVADNNDLGWRAVLPAVMVLTVFAAAAVARSLAERRLVLPVLAVIGLLLALPEGTELARRNIAGEPSAQAGAFAGSPSLWAAVRRHAGSAGRVANNPRDFADMTPWPINIAWALLADRRSCYAGNELAVAFVPWTRSRRAAVEALFARIFDGTATPDDVEQLVSRFDCDVAVITPRDGAWARDPFAASPAFRRVEDAAAWRIYRRVSMASR